MIDGFYNKAMSKKNKDEPLEITNKLLINSGYGFWGYRWENKRTTISGNSEMLSMLLDKEKVYNFNALNDNNFLIDTV